MNTFGWDQMAYWWDEKQGDEGDLWHRALIDPPLLRLAGDLRGLHVLDLACGNGYLSRRFAHQGAIVTAVDANEPLIERIRAREALEPSGITYHVADAAQLDMLEDSIMDLVICNVENDIQVSKEQVRQRSQYMVYSIKIPKKYKYGKFSKGDICTRSRQNLEMVGEL